MNEDETADDFLDRVDQAGRVHLHKGAHFWYTVGRAGAKCGTDDCAIILFEEVVERGGGDE